MENFEKNLMEVVYDIDKNGHNIRQKNREQTVSYINKLCVIVEDMMKDNHYNMPIRIAGNINDILVHLKVKVCDVNEVELLQLAEEAITDIEAVNEEEIDSLQGTKESLKRVDEKAKDREKSSTSSRIQREDEQRNYQDYVQEAIEEIRRNVEATNRTIMMNGERGSAVQIQKIINLQGIIEGNLPKAMQQIHDNGVHEMTKMIETELGYVQNISNDKDVSSQKRLVWDLENYGTTREEVNDKIDKVIEKEVTKDETETRRPPALSSDIIR